jgi:hypothetical protein
MFTYLGMTVTSQGYIGKEIKNVSNVGNAYYNSVHNVLPSCFLSKIIKIHKNHSFTCCAACIYETFVFHPKGGTTLRVCENWRL